MRTASRILFGLGLAAVAFGYWGAETRSGHRVFHEFEIVVPLFVGGVGLLLWLIAAGLWVFSRPPTMPSPPPQ